MALYPLGLGLLLQLAGQASRPGGPLAPKLSGWLSGGGIALIWVFAMPLTSRQLLWGLEERSAALTPKTIPRADAVVVLGGGLRPALAPRQAVEVAEGVIACLLACGCCDKTRHRCCSPAAAR